MEAVAPPVWQAFVAGSFGGLCNTITGHPFDTVKVRIQTGRTQNLFRGLSRGIMTPVSSVVPFWAIYYGGYKFGRSLQPDDSAASVARAGVVAGCFGSIVWCPMQAVKCVAQDRRLSIREALQVVWRKGGLKCLYRGFTPTLLLFSVPGTAAFYWTYEVTRQSAGDEKWGPFVAGGVAGVIEWTVGMPGDTLRTRYQTGFHYPNARSCAFELWQSEGCAGFYRGYSAALPRAFVCNAAALAGIDVVGRVFRNA